MTKVKTRKLRIGFTVEQKLDYAKFIVNEGYTYCRMSLQRQLNSEGHLLR